jgi:hypothetical protein
MRTLSATLALLALLTLGATCQAAIVDATLADDGDGVVTCFSYGLHEVAPFEYEQTVQGIHNIWETGHVLGTILTDTELDPKLTLLHDIDNDTGWTWTDYHAEVTMDKSFTFDNVTVDNAWTYQVSQPVQVGSNWVGTIDYYAGVPVPDGGALSFGYRMTFIGTAHFSEALTPTPEPSTLVMAACGLVGLLVVRRKFAR